VEKTTIALVGNTLGRGTAPDVQLPTPDQIFVNCVPEVMQNPISGQAEVWVNKLSSTQTWGTTSTTALSVVYWWEAQGVRISAGVTGSNIEINYNTTLCAQFPLVSTYGVLHISETSLGAQPCLMFVIDGNQAYYWPLNAGVAGPTTTFTGDLSSGSALVTNIGSTATIYEGQAISGTGIPAGTRVQSVDSATQITMTANATSAGGAGTTITRTVIAKIINSNFPGNAGYTLSSGFVHMDGFAFIQTSDGKVWNSTINTVATWTASGYAPSSTYPDGGRELARVGSYIVAMQTGSYETYVNAGTSPSPLQRVPQLSEKIGTGTASNFYLFPGGAMAKEVDDAIYFFGQTSGERSGDIAIYRMVPPGKAERVSNTVVDKYYAQILSTGSGVWIQGAGTFNGQKAIFFRLGWVYFPHLKLWWRQTVYSEGTSDSLNFTSKDGKNYIVDGGTTIKYNDPTSPVYTGVTSTLQTSAYELSGGNLTYYDQAEITAKRRTTSGNTTVYVSDDDGATWDSVGTVDLSVLPAQIRALGTAQRRAWKIEDSVAANHQIQALRLRYAALKH